MSAKHCARLVGVALLIGWPVLAQQTSIAVTGAVAQPLTLTAADLAKMPRATAADGYQIVFSLAELDPDITDNQYLVADVANGKPLTTESGPFRLVVPKDKRGARWVRMLATLNVAFVRPRGSL